MLWPINQSLHQLNLLINQIAELNLVVGEEVMNCVALSFAEAVFFLHREGFILFWCLLLVACEESMIGLDEFSVSSTH